MPTPEEYKPAEQSPDQDPSAKQRVALIPELESPEVPGWLQHLGRNALVIAGSSAAFILCGLYINSHDGTRDIHPLPPPKEATPTPATPPATPKPAAPPSTPSVPPASFKPIGDTFGQIYTHVEKKNPVFTISTNVPRKLITSAPDDVVVEELSMDYGSCFDAADTMSPAKTTPAILVTDKKGGSGKQFTEIQPTSAELKALQNARLQYLWNIEKRGKSQAEIVLPSDQALKSVAVSLSGISCLNPEATAYRPSVDSVQVISRGGVDQSGNGDQNGGINFFVVAGLVIAAGYGIKKLVTK